MKQPEKWKETIDPFTLDFKNFKLLEILGYPHARNDVFYCKGIFKGKEVFCFLKYASKIDSNIIKEIEILQKLDLEFLPEILDFDKEGKYIVTKEIEGERLSEILKDESLNPLDYMFEYGKTLAKIHKYDIKTERVKPRKFFEVPSLEYLKEQGIEYIFDYLVKNYPKDENICFCHGDFHYANILWKNNQICAVLDWELSGIGNREFDIAWSVIHRPGQKFLNTDKEVKRFLEGYQSLHPCDVDKVEYFMILIYSHFISVDKNNQEYKQFVKGYLKKDLIK